VAKTARSHPWNSRNKVFGLADNLLNYIHMIFHDFNLRRLGGFLAVVVTASAAQGCAGPTYQISRGELARLATIAPENRGASVRVEQELGSGTRTEGQETVTSDTQIVFFPRVIVTNENYGPRNAHPVDASIGRPGVARDHTASSPTSSGGRSGGGNLGDDAKAAAIVAIAVAVSALVIVAVIEGDRFEGDVQLHPMHPVHVFGRDGNYVAMPLAAIDGNVAAWADHAVVRDDEGPWRELSRAPLNRNGWTHGILTGVTSMRSADGNNGTGPSTSIEIGHFFSNQLGVLAFGQLAWRDNTVGNTIFEQRYGGQLQFMPLTVGILSAGLYGGAGVGVRVEDGIANNGRKSGFTLQGGVQLQLDVNTHIGITARGGVVQAYGENIREMLVGMSVY
jgi:hypothetical protein